MLYRDIPFLQFTGALAVGIVVGDKLAPSPVPLYLAVSLFIILSLLLLFTRKSLLSPLFGMVITLLLFCSGLSLYHIRMERLISLGEESCLLYLRADDFPEKGERTYSLPASIIACNGKSLAGSNNRMMLYFYDSTAAAIKPGNGISTRAIPRAITDFDSNDRFDYQIYMNRKGFRYLAFINHDFRVESGTKTLRTMALNLRAHLLSTLSDSGLSDDGLAVTAALTLGYRGLLQDELTDSFRGAGITHILAVSGLHVGVLSVLLLSALSFLKGRYRLIPVFITIVAIWIFALVTGLSPSITRASLMFTFIYTGKVLQRPVNSINSLLASGFVILVLDPAMLFDVGFQLSYSAVLYILLFYNDLHSLLKPKTRLGEWLWAMVVVSLLAQLGTLPFVAYYFNSIPLLSIITNLVAIPSLFIILGGGFLIILTHPLPVFPRIIAAIVDKIASLLILLTENISSLKFASLTPGPVSTLLFAIMLMLTPLMLIYILKRESVHIHLLISLIIISVLITMI